MRVVRGGNLSCSLIAQCRSGRGGPDAQSSTFHCQQHFHCRTHRLRLRWLGGSDSPPDEELLAAWRGTVEAFDEFGHRHEAARSRARLASVLVAAGRAAEATPLVADARAVAEELGAAPLLAELDALGTRERSVPSRVETDLTPRESEILALVADGRSNGEIGKHLFISTKTVSVHVSNILAKLGASGRTEAAAIARRRGLLPD